MPFKDYVDSETRKPVIILSDLLVCSRCNYEEFDYERNPANLAGETTQRWIRICKACGDRIAILRKFKNPDTTKGYKRYVLRGEWERRGESIKEGVDPIIVGADYDSKNLDEELRADEPKAEVSDADFSNEEKQPGEELNEPAEEVSEADYNKTNNLEKSDEPREDRGKTENKEAINQGMVQEARD